MRKLSEIARHVGGEVMGDGEVEIVGIRPIHTAVEGDLAFVSNPQYEKDLCSTKASGVIVGPHLSRSRGINLIVCENPYLAFAKAVELIVETPARQPHGIDPGACISPSAQVGESPSIWPFACVGDGATIGDGVTLMPGAYVGEGCLIGNDTILHPGVKIYHGSRIGKRVVLHANVVIGSDGFGFAPDGDEYYPIPQVGRTIIEDDVSVGANTTINRGALEDTIIRRGTKIDSHVVISHNVEIGENGLVVSQVGISGTARLGKHVTLAGQVGVVGHVTIGDDVTVGAQSGVNRSLHAGETYLGTPARPIKEARRSLAVLAKLPQLRREVKALEQRLGDLERRVADAESRA